MGKVYLVGAGPGDPDLITVKGLKAIQEADVILYDRLVSEALLDEANPNADLIFCGKFPSYHVLKQETINKLLIKYAKTGKVVTRLKGGDPFVFGRGAEEADALLKHGIAVEVIPGITSGIAAPAYAGIPVTHRDFSSSFAVVAGHRSEGKANAIDWESLAKGVDTLLIYMGVGNLAHICAELIIHKKDPRTKIAVIQQGTTSNQVTVTGTLETIVGKVQKANLQNPAMIVIGEVVQLHEKLHRLSMINESEFVALEQAF